MNIETINALEKAIKNENLLKKYNLEKIGVFGSFARGEKANDIEEIKLCKEKKFYKYFGMYWEDLEIYQRNK